MFDIFCCVGFDSLFFVKTGEKHPRFYIKIFCFLNIKKARKHGLFKVSIHLVSPIWLRELDLNQRPSGYENWQALNGMSEAPRKSNYKPRGEVISNEWKLLTEAVTSPHMERQTTQGKLHKSKNKKTRKKKTKTQTNSGQNHKEKASRKATHIQRKRAERYICEIYHASG